MEIKNPNTPLIFNFAHQCTDWPMDGESKKVRKGKEKQKIVITPLQ